MESKLGLVSACISRRESLRSGSTKMQYLMHSFVVISIDKVLIGTSKSLRFVGEKQFNCWYLKICTLACLAGNTSLSSKVYSQGRN